MAEKLIYEGKDITDAVEISIATYDTITDCTQADTLRLEFSTKGDGWQNWRPQVGDKVEYKRDGASTGKLYVYDFDIEKKVTTIYASPMPTSASASATQSKSWEKVYLSQIGKELAKRNGLSFELMQMDDVFYDTKQLEKNQSDVALLGDLAKQESAVLVFYNGRIIMMSEPQLESQAPSFELDMEGTTYDCVDQSNTAYGKATVKAGSVTGTFTADASNSNELAIQSVKTPSSAEATRAAKGHLRYANKNTATLSVTTKIIPKLTAGITMTLSGEKPAGWSGTLYAYRIRHEWHNDQTVIFLRRPLEGY